MSLEFYTEEEQGENELPDDGLYTQDCRSLNYPDPIREQLAEATGLNSDNNLEIDMSKLYEVSRYWSDWVGDGAIFSSGGTRGNIQGQLDYINRIFRKDDRVKEDSFVVLTNYKNQVKKIGLDEISSEDVGQLRQFDVQVSHTENSKERKLRRPFLCQKGHITYYELGRGEEMKKPPTCSHPNGLYKVDRYERFDDERCNCAPHRELDKKKDFESVGLPRHDSHIINMTVQQMILSKPDVNDYESINIGAEVDEHMVGDFESRDKMSIIARVITTDDDANDGSSYYLHILGYDKFDDSKLTDADIDDIWEKREDIDEPFEYLAKTIGNSEGIVDNGNGHISRARKAVLLSLVKGDSNTDNHNIHIMLYGLSGSGKSSLANSAVKISDIGEVVDIQKSTEAGIVGSNAKVDEFGGKFILQAGTLTQASGGVCLIDELDKTERSSEQQVLGEPMEKGFINIDKQASGKLPADVSIIATSNPQMSKNYTDNPIIKCCPVADHIIDRTDLILRVDPYDKTNNGSWDSDDFDSREDMLKQSRKNQIKSDSDDDDCLSEDELSDYIKYAKSLDPDWSDSAIEYMCEKIVTIEQEFARSQYLSERVGDQIQNMSSAIAKLNLNDEITEDNIDKAVDFYIDSWSSVLK